MPDGEAEDGDERPVGSGAAASTGFYPPAGGR